MPHDLQEVEQQAAREMHAAVVAAHRLYGNGPNVQVANYDDVESFVDLVRDEEAEPINGTPQFGAWVEAFVWVPASEIAVALPDVPEDA